MRFVIFAEGYTEQFLPAFFKRWLDPQLARPVGFHVVKFNGWSQLVAEAAVRAHQYFVGQESLDVIAVIGLLDLYGPDFYPVHRRSVAERHEWAVHHLNQKVNHPKFRMHFAVHEVEAWLLAHPEIMPRNVSVKLPKRPPETVNFDEPPSRLLDRLFHANGGTGYHKVRGGRKFFARLDPSIAATKCPHLDALLNDMLSMAKAAGL